MIPITIQPEPVDFDSNVRQLGNRFLSSCPNPTGKDWKKHSYWKNANGDLYRVYRGICAYTGEWFSRTSTTVSIDHFLPKVAYPLLAYEWSNYRLTTQKVNSNKSDQVGVADPSSICSGWFTLHLPSCLVMPGDNLSSSECAMVQRTIDILKLNTDDDYVQRRCDIILDYIKGDISLNYMWSKFPFIAHELTRQDVLEEVKQIFKSFA